MPRPIDVRAVVVEEVEEESVRQIPTRDLRLRLDQQRRIARIHRPTRAHHMAQSPYLHVA